MNALYALGFKYLDWHLCNLLYVYTRFFGLYYIYMYIILF